MFLVQLYFNLLIKRGNSANRLIMILEVLEFLHLSPSVSLSLVQMISFYLTQSCAELPFLYHNNVTQILILLKKKKFISSPFYCYAKVEILISIIVIWI